MKFSYEPLETQNFWEIPISEKWVPVTVESPDVITPEDREDMLFRMDNVFTWFGLGNDHDFEAELFKRAKVNEETREIPWETCMTEVFRVDLFSSSYVGGPSAFFNYRTGKVSGCFQIGKWPGSVKYAKDELEFVAKRYPRYRFFVTFFDYFYVGKKCECRPVCTLLVHNGKITQVKTRTSKEVSYTELTDYTYGSTGCKHKNFLDRYMWNRENWLTKLMIWVCLRLPRFSFREPDPTSCQEEQYFSKEEAYALAEKWVSKL